MPIDTTGSPVRISPGLRAAQMQVYHSGARFRMVAARRRLGKTHCKFSATVCKAA
jgi:hypothetical protein